MQKTFMPELSPEQRKQVLLDHADSREETTYYKDLSPEELDQRRERLSGNLIKISEHDDVLDMAKEVHKSHTKPLKQENGMLLTEIKMRKAQHKGVLFNLANHDEGIMETYDEAGDFVSARRLRPDEKQLPAFPLRKAE